MGLQPGEKHFFGKINAKAVIVRDGKVLIGLDNGGGSGLWDLPGGRINVHESIEQALQREIQEELGVSGAEVGKMFFSAHTDHTTDPAEHMYLGFEVKIPDGEINIPDNEFVEIKWLDKSELPALETYPNIRRILEAYFARK